MEKFHFFLPKPWTNPFGEIPVFIFFLNSIFIVLRHFFSFLEYRQTRFPGLFFFKNEKWKKTTKFLTKAME